MTVAKVKRAPSGALWQVTATGDKVGDKLEHEIDCDVAIVGAGFTGLRAALHLAENGIRVAVFDSGEIAFGASGRSGGQVNPMLPVARPDILRKAIGNVHFERVVEASLSSADALFELIRRYGIDCDARQNGWLRVDHCAAARQTARAAAREWNAHGAGFEFVEGDEARRLSGSPVYVSGTFTPRGGAVQPLSLALGMARVARAAGASIYQHAPVTAAERKHQKWHLIAGGQRVVCRQVILATNGYSGNLYKPVKKSVLPLLPLQMATDPLPQDVIGTILPQGNTISDTRRMIMYARREPDNRMVYGGMGFKTPLGGVGGFGWLLSDVKRVFPALKDVEWKYRWSGQIALTDDRVPHFHEPEPGMLAGLGYNGRGVAMSFLMGKLLADRALGADPGSLALPCTQPPTVPFRDTQVFGAGIAMSWMRLRDTMDRR